MQIHLGEGLLQSEIALKDQPLTCKNLSQWGVDEFVTKAVLNSTTLTLYLQPLKLLQAITGQVSIVCEFTSFRPNLVALLQIVKDADTFGATNLNFGRKCIVEYELPSPGSLFDNHHFRGVMTAGFVINFLKMKGYVVDTRCRLRLWTFENGKLLSSFVSLQTSLNVYHYRSIIV
jgi:hypothetical protein